MTNLEFYSFLARFPALFVHGWIHFEIRADAAVFKIFAFKTCDDLFLRSLIQTHHSVKRNVQLSFSSGHDWKDFQTNGQFLSNRRLFRLRHYWPVHSLVIEASGALFQTRLCDFNRRHVILNGCNKILALTTLYCSSLLVAMEADGPRVYVTNDWNIRFDVTTIILARVPDCALRLVESPV